MPLPLWPVFSLVALGVAGARTLARHVAREYVRSLVRLRLRQTLLIAAVQLAVVAAVYGVLRAGFDGWALRLAASAVVWGLIAFNAVRFCFGTVPELLAIRRTLRGSRGYAWRYLLGASVAKVLVELDLILLMAGVILAITARANLSSAFHLTAPWLELGSRVLPR